MDKKKDPNYKNLTVYLPKGLWADFKAYCARQEVTQSVLIEELVSKLLYQPTQLSFVSLLQDKDLELLVKPAGMPLEKLREIADGARPCDEDLVGLSRALNMTSDELLEIRRRIFGNGYKSEVKCGG